MRAVMMMPVTAETFSRDFAKNWGRSYDVSMRNYADHIVVNMRKLAPFASGTLVHGIHAVRRSGHDVPRYEVVCEVPYGIRRNFENNLHPQTKHYVERSVSLTHAGGSTQWWKSV